MAQQITIDRLLNQVPDSPSVVLSHLQANPQLASAQDRHGYSLLHAATSYNHADLLRSLVNDFKVDVNIKDEDGETPIFAAENVEIARVLVEELGARTDIVNEEGQTAEQKLQDEDEAPIVAAYLKELAQRGSGAEAASVVAQTGPSAGGLTNGSGHPPPMPAGLDLDVKFGTMQEPEGDGPDPEFRRRIEELAAREDFQTEAGQAELRRLVEDAVSGLGSGSASRRRVD